jgi:nucleotide-binding universal stress UspA family protein
MPHPAVRTILLATDLTDRCRPAAARAASLARQWQARLHVLTVLDAGELSGPQADAARRKAEELALASLGGFTGAEMHVLAGSADTSIISLADTLGADLIITGRTGGTWLGQTLLGQTLKQLIRRIRVPVLLVKRPVERSYHRVAVAVDLSDASRAPIETATSLFGSSAWLTLFHGFSAPHRLFSGDIKAYEAGVREGVTLEIREALRAWSIPEADRLPITAAYGEPAPALVEFADKQVIDLVVTGTHGRTGLMNLMLGSVAEAIVERVPSDILIAPSRGAWRE